jgi:filamentous hemagglutinin
METRSAVKTKQRFHSLFSKPHSKRSTAMKSIQFLKRSTAVFAAVLLMAGSSIGQNLRTSSNITGTGTINVKQDIENTNGIGTAVTISPTVVMNGNAGATTQNITATVAGSDINFTTLRMLMDSPKAIDTDISIATNWQLGDGTAPNALDGDVSFSSARTIAVADASSYDNTNNTATLVFSGGTVNFTKAATSQTVLNTTAGVGYGTLSLSGGATKSFQTGGTVTAVTATHAGGDLTVDRALTVSGSGSFATIADITAAMSFGAGVTSATITTVTDVSTGSLTNNATGASLSIGTLSDNSGTITNTNAGGISFTTTAANGTGTIETSGGGGLTFAALTGNTGTIRSTAAGTLSFTGAAVNANVISAVAASGAITFGNTLANSGGTAVVTAGGGGITFTGNVTNGTGATILAGTGGYAANLDFNSTTVNNTGGVIQLGTQGTSTFAGSFSVGGSGTLTLDAASIWTYDGAAQDMASATYGVLRTAGSATKTALGNITAADFDNGGTGDLAITTDMHIYSLSVSGAKDNTNGTLRLGGSNGFSFATLLAAGGTVIYDGVTGDVASQSIATGSYYNLSFEGDATKDIAAAVAVSSGNDVTLANTVTMNIAATGTLNVGLTGTGVGAFTLQTGSTLSNLGDVNVAGDLDNSGSLTNDGTITVGY